MKKVISIILAFALCMSLFAIHAGAALPPVVYGDLNYDYEADIIDVTLIQRGLIGITEFSYEAQLRADFDHDGEASIIDATWIQRKDVGMTIPENFGGEADQNILVTSFYADYDSGKATCNIPVTFTARANCGEEGCTYEFFIDGQLVQERSVKNTFTYTFTYSGDYDVMVRAYNKDGFRASSKIYQYYYDYPCETSYRVVDSYPTDKFELIAVNCIDLMYSSSPEVAARASGGTAPYTYNFTIPEAYDCEGDSNWKLLYDDNNIPYLYRDFSEENSVFIPFDLLEPRTQYELIVQAKDANGNLTEQKSIFFDDEILIG